MNGRNFFQKKDQKQNSLTALKRFKHWLQRTALAACRQNEFFFQLI